MTPPPIAPPTTSGGAGRLLRVWCPLGLLAVLVLPISYGAVRAFPVWDDAALWFAITEHGPASVRLWHADRPLAAFLESVLAARGVLWGTAKVLHPLAWLALGLVTSRLWKIIFPDLIGYAPVAAWITIAPVFCQTQLILVNPIVDAQLGCVAAFTALLLCDWCLGRADWVRRIAVVTATAMTCCGVMLSEYALAALLAGGAAMALVAWMRPDRQRRRQLWLYLGSLAATAAVSYLVYHRLASGAERLVVRPEYQLRTQGLKRLAELPLRIGFAIWEAGIGNLASAMAGIHLTQSVVPAMGLGLLTAGTWFWWQRSHAAIRPERLAEPPLSHPLVALLLALGLGLCPIILMKVSPRPGTLSRLWLPIAPVASCFALGLLLRIVAAEVRRKVALAVAFGLGFTTGSAVAVTIHSHDEVVAIGSRLRQQLSPDGLTVALFTDYTWFTLGVDAVPDSNELTARLTSGWSDAERKAFWATVSDYVYASQSFDSLATTGVCDAHQSTLSAEPSGVGLSRVGAIGRILHVSRSPQGTYLISRGNVHDNVAAPRVGDLRSR